MADGKSVKYSCCPRLETSLEVLRCSVCKNSFHYSCLNITKTPFKDLTENFKTTWECPACNCKKPKSCNNNTPVRGLHAVDSQEPDVASQNVAMRKRANKRKCLSPDLSLLDIRQVIREELECIKSNMLDQFNAKIKEVIQTVTEITSSMTFIEQQYEDIKKDLKEKETVIYSLEAENKALRITVNDLASRTSAMEQHARANNVEIQCIPEHKSEHLLTCVKQLAATVNYKINDSDIHLCTRISKFNRDSNRPRSVVVKFGCQRIRDEFLAATVNFNKKFNVKQDKLNTSHLGIGGEQKPIYVVEHLSPALKALHASARVKAKEKNYRFVWVKGGQIFMRKSEKTEYIHVRNNTTLANLP